MSVSFTLLHYSTIGQGHLIHHACVGLSDENVCLSHILNNIQENEGEVQGALSLDLIYIHALTGSHTPEETAHVVKYSCVPATLMSLLLFYNLLTKFLPTAQDFIIPILQMRNSKYHM